MLWPAGGARSEPKSNPPLAIAQVTTWAELRAQPPLELPGGGWLRLGMRCRSAPVHSGTLLYGLVGGGARVPTSRSLRDGERALGPVSFRTHFEGGPICKGVSLIGMASRDVDKVQESLYAGALVVSSRKALHVEVSLPQGRLLAKGRIDPVPAQAHPWMSLRQSGQRQDRLRAAGRPVTVTLTPKSGTWGTPDVCGLLPIAAGKKKAPRPQGPLPTLFPSASDPTLGLELTLDGFILTSTKGLPWSWLEDRLLYRLWIGERPLVRPFKAHAECKMGSGPDVRAKRIHVCVDWDLGAVGAKTSAPVSLQVLWCPAGWRDGLGLERASVEIDPSDLLPRLTPRR